MYYFLYSYSRIYAICNKFLQRNRKLKDLKILKLNSNRFPRVIKLTKIVSDDFIQDDLFASLFFHLAIFKDSVNINSRINAILTTLNRIPPQPIHYSRTNVHMKITAPLQKQKKIFHYYYVSYLNVSHNKVEDYICMQLTVHVYFLFQIGVSEAFK